VTAVPPILPNHMFESTYRPRIVKARKNTGLDNTAGDTCASGYAIGENGVERSYHTQNLSSSSEGGIVQNMPGEARVLFMGTFNFSKERSRHFDYIAENTGRPNSLGNQSQNNCMLLRSSQHAVPSSIALDYHCLEQSMKTNIF
jgi:hypothetical protein